MLAVAFSVTASFEGDKVLIAAVIFILTLFGTYIPWLLNAACCESCLLDDETNRTAGPGTALTSTADQRHQRLKERVMNVLSCLAGGVILGAGFTHILPDAVDAWGEYYASRGDDPDNLYPMAYAVALGTLLFLWSIDRIWGHSGGGGHGHSHGGHSHGSGGSSHGGGHSHGHVHDAHGSPQCAPGYGTNSVATTAIPAGGAHYRTPSASDAKSNGTANGNGATGQSSDASAPGVAPVSPIGSGMNGDDIALDVARTAAARDAAVYDSNYFDPATDVSAASNSNADSDERAAQALARAEKRRHAYVLCTAMTFHAVCDGLALGTESEEDRKFAAVLLAVAVHKWLDGMAVGVPVFAAFMQPRPQWYVIVPVCVFTSLMTPLGIFIGMSWGGEPVSKAILLSISAGSFIFIPLIEMIPLGIDDGKRVPFKFFVVAVGATAMAILAAWS